MPLFGRKRRSQHSHPDPSTQRAINALEKKIDALQRQSDRGEMSVDLHDEDDRMDNCVYDIVGESRYRDQLQQLVDGAVGAGLLQVEADEWVNLGVTCWLVPEPQNEYDPDAVAVYAGDGDEPAFQLQVGYLPRGTGHGVSDWERVDGRIVGRSDGQQRWGVKVNWSPAVGAAPVGPP